jgi:hypothetical protein
MRPSLRMRMKTRTNRASPHELVGEVSPSSARCRRTGAVRALVLEVYLLDDWTRSAK